MNSIHEPNNASAKREFNRSLVETIQEASPDGILVVDDKEIIVSHNQRLFEVFDIEPEELPGDHDEFLTGLPDQPLLSRVLELVKDRDNFLRRVQALYANPELEDLCEIELTDGRTLERHSRALWDRNHHYLGRVWFFRDITAHKQMERALEEMAHRDPLTGVANRRFFTERAAEEFARARRSGHELSFIVLDIDHFKQVNDRWGHAAGDKVLKKLCECSQAVLRQEDLFGRLGGEEFAVLVPDTDLEGAFLLAERLRRCATTQAVVVYSDTISYTISAGVATLAPEDTTTEFALQRADEALYTAKHAGRNCTMRQNTKDQ